MHIEYDLENDTIQIFAIDGEVVPIEELLNALPSQIAVDYRLLRRINELREQVIEQVGEYNLKIAELNKKMEDYLTKLEECEPSASKEIKFYQGLIHNIGKKITAMKELRHGTKLLAIQEGKLMAELARLEV